MNRATPQIIQRWKLMHELRQRHTLREVGEMLGVSLWSVFKCVEKYRSYLLSQK